MRFTNKLSYKYYFQQSAQELSFLRDIALDRKKNLK